MPGEKRIESTLVGLKYPSTRDGILTTGAIWLDGKRQDDGAEGLWRVGEKLYDLEGWARNHPGGAEWIELTRGTDITEAFEVHHIGTLAEDLLPKFYVRDAREARASPYTFEPDGFYRKLKTRVRDALRDVDYHKSSRTSRLVADSLLVVTLALCLAASATRSWIAILACGVFLNWTMIAAHNFFHQRDSFRMYYFDIGLFSSREWRITHVLSHHIFTNTLQDVEMTVFEPFLQWLPRPDKNSFRSLVSCVISPVIYAFIGFEQGAKRVYSIIFEWNGPDARDALPFLIPALMSLYAPPLTVLGIWLALIFISSFYFAFIGLNVGHHHPDLFHDGDVHREDNDWGLAVLDTVRGRSEIDPSTLLVLTHFGQHTLHHLLPTIDHAYLQLCEPAFIKTCEEFGVDTAPWSQWECVKGQFMQLRKSQPKKTPNGR